jgi:hypothetical protein
MLVGVLALSLVACSTPAPLSTSSAPPKAAVQPVKVDPYAAIPADGPHEKAAYAAVPEALEFARGMAAQQKRPLTDVSAATATLVSYTLEARVGTRLALFEVRGDGKAYELYRYPAAPDPRTLFWRDASGTDSAFLAKPAGPGETAAAAAVRKVVEEAAPGDAATVSIYGYNFYWIKPDGTPMSTAGGSPFTMNIDPAGNTGSWSS